MSNNTDGNNTRAPSNSGIRLPPISFLGSLNNPRHSPPPQSSQGSSQPPSTVLSSQMGLAHLVSTSSQTNPSPDMGGTTSHPHSRNSSSSFQLPPLSAGGDSNNSGFNQSRLSSLDPNVKQESEDKRSVYSLPTPVQLGIDIRRQNISNDDHQQQQLLQQLLLQLQQREEDDLREKRLKEERKRKNKEKREREKLLRQQQQMLYEQQLDLERRRLVEENERQHRVNEEPRYASGTGSMSPTYIAGVNQHQQEQSYHHQKQLADDTQEDVVPFKRQHTTINNSPVLDDLELFPRRHIGTILYQQYPTKSTVVRKLRLTKDHEKRLQEDEIEYQIYLNKNRNYLKNRPSKIINLIPPYLKYYINSLIDIKISFKDIVKNENVFKRNVWGTDIYTDDSDIVSILYHCGIIPSKSPFPEDKEKDKIEPITPGNKLNSKSIQNLAPFDNPTTEGDLIVTLIILPLLTQYQGSYRNNYNSRSWLSTHDGGSIAIYNVKWCHFGDSYGDNNYADIKKTALTDTALLRHQMDEDEKFSKQQMLNENKENDTLETNFTRQQSLNSWSFDKDYLKSTANASQAKVQKEIAQEDEDEEKRGNDTTILLNQTTQHHTDDTTIQDVTRHDDTTIDDRS